MNEDWVQTTLGDIAEVVGGGTPKTSVPEYWGGSVPWITPTEVTAQEGEVITATQRTITKEGLARSSANLLPEGTVLLTSRATIGAVAIAGVPMATNQGFASLVAGPRVIPEFLMYWCQVNRRQLRALAVGNTFLEVSKSNVRSLRVDLPPLSDQRRIVDLVQTFDAHEASISHLDESLRAVRGGLRTALYLHAETPRVPLGDLCGPSGIQLGPFGSQLHASDYVHDGVPVVMPKDIRNGSIRDDSVARIRKEDAQRLQRHVLLAGDIVLPRRGDLTKRALVTAEQAGFICGTGCARVRLADSSTAKAVFEALSTSDTDRWLEEHAVGTTMKNLNTDIVSRIPIPRPPDEAAGVTVLQVIAQTLRHLADTAGASSGARAALVVDLLTGRRSLPSTYDRFLEAV